ncbi:HpaII family restriction endonuclease [Psychrobacillus sp. FSL K6-1415]|uniref:HpaII family restriction endonuclease n=1 Tax=Psychrobacillus sp. FSL K6-1415 TaxID=2921544 RepID=UPI0030F4DD2E
MKGNKGEWSEIYTFLKLLGDGIIYAGDENSNTMNSIFYPLISIVREEEGNFYYYNRESTNIKVINGDGNILLTVNDQRFREMSESLYHSLGMMSGRSFEFPKIEEFLNNINVKKMKSDSSIKRDITIVVHDLNTNTSPTLGFSIKSRLGGNSTLLNSGETTNFNFEISPALDTASNIKLKSLVNAIDSRSKIKDRIKYLLSNRYLLDFKNIGSKNFKLNLQMIDTLLPEMVGEMLLYYYNGQATTMKELVDLLEENNPLDFDQSSDHKFYETKIKNFLTDVALGMTPQKKWTGLYDATGGYIIVREDGEIVCYHIYNRNEFQEYLLRNTFLDTPSSSRYRFGEIYESQGKLFIKLNLQIRFH